MAETLTRADLLAAVVAPPGGCAEVKSISV